LLIGGQESAGGAQNGGGQILGTFLVIGGALCWATGSIYGLRAPSPKSPILVSGMQMLCGGLVLSLVGVFTGEWSAFNIAEVSTNSWLGFVYLIIFGSLIGFTAYSWLLKNAAPAMVSTYAYINPVIAVFLGWLIAGESFTGQMLIGAGVIVSSVMLITSHNSDEGSTEEEIHESQTRGENCATLST
jgi:drug/metabolite transporter (DMT)-like permease